MKTEFNKKLRKGVLPPVSKGKSKASPMRDDHRNRDEPETKVSKKKPKKKAMKPKY